MKEIKDIIRAYGVAREAGKHTALATVVSVEGSSYRRPGARMLITEDGELTGAISGGCLEGDALRKALFVMSEQRAMVVTYDTTDEDDASIGVGLGCNGIIRILIEPIIEAQHHHPLTMLQMLQKQREPAVVITVFSFDKSVKQHPGTCLLYLPGRLAAAAHEDRLVTDFSAQASQAFSSQNSFATAYEENGITYTALVELIKPPVSFVICGAGNDAIPMTKMAAVLGWDVTVIDGRRNYAKQERFPGIQKLILSNAESALADMHIDAETVFILMTHNYNYDLAIFKQLITKQTSYIGVLGPRKRLHRLLDDLKEQNVELRQSDLNKVYGPAGLDIGAETAEEIALSVISEIKTVLNHKTGHSLRTKEGSIHEPFPLIKSDT